MIIFRPPVGGYPEITYGPPQAPRRGANSPKGALLWVIPVVRMFTDCLGKR